LGLKVFGLLSGQSGYWLSQSMVTALAEASPRDRAVTAVSKWSLNMKIHFLLVALAAPVLASSPSLGQDADDVAHGRVIAQTICAACHVVAKGQLLSPNTEAPPFPVLAATPGMTNIALTAALLTSHRQMPNIILQSDERRDVIAYILSLK
jgi:mono/diheme cytochrome c family protein